MTDFNFSGHVFGPIAGRDLYLTHQETLFSQPSLDDVDPNSWVNARQAQEFVEIMTSQRLLVLAGTELSDKSAAARHVAWHLRRALGSDDVPVREWYRSADTQRLPSSLGRDTILILPQVLPHNVGHRLQDLWILLENCGGFAIITTDGSNSQWNIDRGAKEERFWREISWDKFYGLDPLFRFLLKELERASRLQKSQSLAALSLSTTPDEQIVHGISFGEIIESLREPARIRWFVKCLSSPSFALKPSDVEALLDQISSSHTSTRHWYRNLPDRSKLMAMGLALLDGLQEDQAFSGLRVLVDAAWRQSDRNLTHFDRDDLESLGANFNLVRGESGTRLETSSRQQQAAILEAAWELKREHLTYALFAITNLIKGTVVDLSAVIDAKTAELIHCLESGLTRALFGSSEKQRQLQQTAIESLSQVGLLSFETVEPFLLDLATYSFGTRVAVAKSLAAWCGRNQELKLLRIIKGWWKIGRDARPVLHLEKAIDLPSTMRAAAGLTVAFAAQFDPPNGLKEELRTLFEKLITDKSKCVIEALENVVIPMLAGLHLKQLESLLRVKVLTHDSYVEPVGRGIALAWELRPAETLGIVNDWYSSTKKGEMASRGKEHGHRERLLAALALGCGFLRSTAGHDNVEAAFDLLQTISRKEKHPYVRRSIFQAVGNQAFSHAKAIYRPLQRLANSVTLKERASLVNALCWAGAWQLWYRDSDESDTDQSVSLRDAVVNRQATDLEEVMFRWISDFQYPVAQQVAMEVFSSLAQKNLKGKMNWPTNSSLQTRRLPYQKLNHLSIPFWLAVCLAAPNNKRLRKAVKMPLAEVIRFVDRPPGPEYLEVNRAAKGTDPQKASHGLGDRVARAIRRTPTIELLMDRLIATGNEEIKLMARAIGRVLIIYRCRHLAAGLGLLFLVLSMAFYFHT